MPELTCPVCGGALHREERSLRCGAGHCYDLARQGYVNLLRTNRSKDKRHGDDKRMVAARTAFLDAGYYAPLRDAIAAAATEYTSGDAGVLDAGCGEGYYTAHVLHTLQAQGASPSVCGVDISRDALICAHRRAPELTLAVASIAHLPVADASCDLVLNVFAPHDAAEFARVLRPQGCCCVSSRSSAISGGSSGRCTTAHMKTPFPTRRCPASCSQSSGRCAARSPCARTPTSRHCFA